MIDTQAISKQLAEDIDEYTLATYSEPYRTHLGASAIGHPCWRKSWLAFRWCKAEQAAPRMLRLWQRGHREEPWFISLLEGIGCTVWATNPDTGKQWRFSAIGGHYGGSCDAQVQLPTAYGVPGRVLGESKTNGTGAGFNAVKNKGCDLGKPQHFIQQCIYGANFGNDYSIYYVANKNDDDLHIELVKLDHNIAHEMQRKAETIILAVEPPKGISQNSAHVDCKMCHFAGICHAGDLPDKNCRSCEFAAPADQAAWRCNKFGQDIPRDFIAKGCAEWKPIINRKV